MARKWLGTRIFSIAALCGSVLGVGYIGKTGYHVATDAFVVPVVLSPDSDLVISSKLSRASLVGERMRGVTKKEQIDADLEAADQSIAELKVLQASATKSLEWTTKLTATQTTAGVTDLKAIGNQQGEISAMVKAQEALVEQTKKELEAGLVAKTDYARELNALGQLRISALEHERTRLASDTQMTQLTLTQQAMRNARAGGMTTPEMQQQQSELVRIKCEIVKLEAERRAKSSERAHLDEELTKLDELIAQLNSRPIFRAIDASTNVVFIPYSQLDGVTNGSKVFECVLGLVACTPVGQLTELLPGEVIVPDPWGSPARGRYAVVQLDDQHAAQSKTLRVRPSGTPVAPPAENTATKRVANK